MGVALVVDRFLMVVATDLGVIEGLLVDVLGCLAAVEAGLCVAEGARSGVVFGTVSFAL